MRQIAFGTALTAVFSLTALSGTSSAEVTRAELMAQTCLACHGATGDGPDDTIPSLVNGYPGNLIARNLKDFRDGKREATVMQRHATGYSDEEIQSLADYFDSMQ